MYQSSPAKKSRSRVVAPPFAKPVPASWKPKSSVASSRPAVLNEDRYAGLASYTSPKAKKSGLPIAAAWSRIAGANSCQNSRLTCLTVSMRKPSMPKSTQVL